MLQEEIMMDTAIVKKFAVEALAAMNTAITSARL